MEIFKKIYTFFFDTFQTILLVFSVFLVVYLFLARPFEVSGESMFPTFKNGEFVLTDLFTIRFADLQKGDVIVFQAPVDQDKDYIKRIIATGGDTVRLENGSVYVNDERLDENDYLPGGTQTTSRSFLSEGSSVTVPQNSFFVLGDNRPHSSDSRDWGFLEREDVIGRSFFVYWPVTKARIVENPNDN